MSYIGGRKIELPPAAGYTGLSVGVAVERRRSVRRYSGEAMSLSEFSHLLYYSEGITERRFGLRAAPSAGALYPIELYPVVNNVEGLSSGIYHYSAEDHSLDVVREGDFREELARHGAGQRFMGRANVALIMTAVFERSRWRYRERANRYIFLEAGHIGQNVHLVATSLGLGSCAIGAFYDDGFNGMLGLDGVGESVIYIMVVGKTSKGVP